MSSAAVQFVRGYLRLASPLAEASDGCALDLYTHSGDAGAFARLVELHGPMVLGVCRRVLGRGADAEDAFQATFLTLARQARSIRERDNVAAWLHRVAYRIARKAKARVATPTAEAVSPPIAADDPLAEASWREVRRALDEELGRLPEDLRAPLVLCYLDGATRDEAARRLGWSLSTLKRRLERGREVLRVRLLSRGVAPVALAAATLLPGGLRAAVPVRLAQAASALGGAFGSAASSSPAVLSLAQAGMRPMTRLVLKSMLVALIVAGGLAAGLATLSGGAQVPKPEGPKPPPPNRPAEHPPEDGKGPRTDRFGDPLPAGALHRFGTVRFRPGGAINGSSLSSDGKRIVVASSTLGITVFDMDTGRPLHALRQSEMSNGFSVGRSLVAFAPDGKTFASVAYNQTVRLWDAETGKEVLRLLRPNVLTTGLLPAQRPGPVPGQAPREPTLNVKSVRFADGGKAVLASAHNGEVCFLDPKTGKVLHRFHLSGQLAGTSADGKTLIAFAGKDKSEAVLHAAKDGKELRRFEGPSGMQIAALSPDGKTLAAATEAGQVHVWDAQGGKRLHRFEAKRPAEAGRNVLTVIAITPDGKTLLAGTTSGPILRWSLGSGKELSPLTGHLRRVTGLHFPADGKTLVSVSWDGLIRRWDLRGGRGGVTPPLLPTGDGYAGHVHAVLSPDGRVAAVCDGLGRIDVWDARTGKRLHTLRESGPGAKRLAFSPDGGLLASGHIDRRVVLWDTASWKEKRTIRLDPDAGRRTWFEELKFSPDGRFLLTASEQDATRLWETATGKEIWRQAGSGKAAFSPDGRSLVTGGWDKVLHFRDPATGKERFSLSLKEEEKLGGIIDDIVFSPDGRTLVTSHHDATIRFRDPQTGRDRKCLKTHFAWEVSFSPDGKWLLSAGSDHSVRVHEVATGQEVLRLEGHDGRVYHGQFGSDGRTALTAAWDCTALVWSLRPANVPEVKGNHGALWDALRSEEAPTAYRAAWALLDHPKAAADLLRAKLPPVKPAVDRETILKLIADLDADEFRTREAAEKALAQQGAAAQALLLEVLPKAKSAEQRRRIEALLARLKRKPTPDDWRVMRAVQVLELADTPEARRVLREWAGGASGSLLTEQAKAALARLKESR